MLARNYAPKLGARMFPATGGARLISAISPVTSLPVTMTAWVRRRTAWDETAIALGNSANSASVEIAWSWFGGGLPAARAINSNASVAGTAAHTKPLNLNEWHHVAAVFASTTRRVIYVDTAPGVVNTTTVDASPSTWNYISLGTRNRNGTPSLHLRGWLAAPAVWNAELTDAEILSLAMGAHPYQVRRDKLAFLAPMVEGGLHPERDTVNGLMCTPSGDVIERAYFPPGYVRQHSRRVFLPASIAAALAPTIGDLKAVNITATTVQATYDYAF